MNKKTCIAFVSGAIIGAGLGILLAPQSGKETREDIANGAKKLGKKAKELDFDDVKEFVTEKVKRKKA